MRDVGFVRIGAMYVVFVLLLFNFIYTVIYIVLNSGTTISIARAFGSCTEIYNTDVSLVHRLIGDFPNIMTSPM